MMLFPLHIRVACLPTLIYEPHPLLFLQENGIRGSCPPFLCHYKVKYGLVVIYCATLMWRWEIYPPIGYIPASDITSTVREYSQSTIRHQGIQPEIHCANQLWRLPSACIVWWVITHESDPKRITY